MAWERKLMRTVRVRNTQARGVLANLLTSISESGGNIGGIEMLTETSQHVVRDITVYAEDEAHIETIIEAMRANDGTKILQVRERSPSARVIRLTPSLPCNASTLRVWPQSAARSPQ